MRVERSRWSHLRQTIEVELRLRVSEIVAIMLDRITSGRSLSVVVYISPVVIFKWMELEEDWVFGYERTSRYVLVCTVGTPCNEEMINSHG